MTRDAALLAVDAELTRLAHMMASNRGHRLRSERSGTALARHELVLLGDVARHGPTRLTDLAGRLQMELPHASRTVRNLVERGLLQQARDELDGRAVVLRTTRKGAATVERYREASRRLLDEALADWPDRRVDDLAAMLAELTEAFALRPDVDTISA